MSVAALEYRLSTLNALLGVVEALRSLTAAKQQKALSLLPALDAYAGEAAQVMALLHPEPAAADTVVTLVLGPDGGFTGGLAGRIVAALPDGWRPVVVGTRMEAALRARHWPVADVRAASTNLDGLPALAASLAAALPASAGIAVLSPQGQAIVRTDLPPLPQRAGRCDLLTQIPGPELLAAAGRQDRVARLLRLLLANHIAEQMARLATLTGARERIRDRCADLSVQLSMARQDGISQEIADLWAGRRVMRH